MMGRALADLADFVMPLPARTLIAIVALFSVCPLVRAQAPKKEANASVSGKVTVKGKPAAGIVVGMRLDDPRPPAVQYKATTDADGAYRITNIASGNYQISPVARSMVLSDPEDLRRTSLVIHAGDNVEGLNFDLTRGGAITGKVVDADGRPVIEMPITLTPLENFQKESGYSRVEDQTDDRGIFRIFGLRPGRYKISAGEFAGNHHPGRPAMPSTFYPDTPDESKAGIVEVEEGGEAANIDIKVGTPLRQFTVIGRVLESENGKPVANVRINLLRIVRIDANHSSGIGDDTNIVSDSQGQFRFKDVSAGRYELSINASDGFDFKRPGNVEFDVADADVSDLVVKLTRGAMVEGTVVFEGSRKDPPSLVYLIVTNSDDRQRTGSVYHARIKPDGSFALGGVSAGTLSFSINTGGRESGVKLVRVERDGVIQPNAISIQEREHISGLRLFAAVSSGGISGVIQVVNGTLPPGSQFTVQLARADDATENQGWNTWQADSRGRFLVEQLAAGTYQIVVWVNGPNLRRPPTAKQLVTVTDGAVTEVTVKIDLNIP
jgi:5-hydroxyisourate hydrolase-like protein (transthyretin family)